MPSIIFQLACSLLSLLATEYIVHFLCTDYLDSLIEFVQAYITIVDLVRNRPAQRHRP